MADGRAYGERPDCSVRRPAVNHRSSRPLLRDRAGRACRTPGAEGRRQLGPWFRASGGCSLIAAGRNCALRRSRPRTSRGGIKRRARRLRRLARRCRLGDRKRSALAASDDSLVRRGDSAALASEALWQCTPERLRRAARWPRAGAPPLVSWSAPRRVGSEGIECRRSTDAAVNPLEAVHCTAADRRPQRGRQPSDRLQSYPWI